MDPVQRHYAYCGWCCNFIYNNTIGQIFDLIYGPMNLINKAAKTSSLFVQKKQVGKPTCF